MNELNDFLKLISEGKQETIKKSPGKARLKQLQEEIQRDNPFLNLPVSKPPVVNKPAIEVVGEFLYEDGQFVEPNVLTEVVVPEVKPAAEQVPMNVIDKYLKQNASFQQPDPDKVDPNIPAIQNKLKFLEQAIGKIAATGPGSGEVRLRYLDDVNRNTIANGRYLRYDQATTKFVFDNPNAEEIGVLDYLQLNEDGPGIETLPGMLSWNPSEDCLDVTQNDGTVLQVGLEQYIRVKNETGQTLTNGTVVRFSGVNGNYEPTVVPHIADGTVPPLYTVGVLTHDIPTNTIGRATSFGKIRNINTTGSDVGETWQQGDILYTSPTNAGKLTKVKPTAPDVVISVAAILRVHATEGILLVRPTIFPRLYYGSFTDTTDQTATTINTPYAVKYNTTDIANGHRIENNTRVVADNSGLYNYQFSLQLSSTSSSKKEVYIWARKNGQDIPNSATRITLSGNDVYQVAAWNFVVSMNAGDYFQLMWATNDTGAKIDAPTATAFSPAIPSVILTVTEAAL